MRESEIIDVITVTKKNTQRNPNTVIQTVITEDSTTYGYVINSRFDTLDSERGHKVMSIPLDRLFKALFRTEHDELLMVPNKGYTERTEELLKIDEYKHNGKVVEFLGSHGCVPNLMTFLAGGKYHSLAEIDGSDYYIPFPIVLKSDLRAKKKPVLRYFKTGRGIASRLQKFINDHETDTNFVVAGLNNEDIDRRGFFNKIKLYKSRDNTDVFLELP